MTIAPISFHGKILIPNGSRLLGSVDNVKRFGLGLKQITAEIRFHFDELWLPNGNAISIQAELAEVETAKERVDIGGAARGIHPAVSLSASVSLVTTPLLFVVPAIGAPVWIAKSLIAPAANPEIYFPSGTELILQLTAPVEVRARTERPTGISSFPPDVLSTVQQLLSRSAQRARLGTHPSDLVNILFLGSREEMDRAFQAAGWVQAQRKSPMSLFRMYRALTERIGYKRAPMNALTLNGVPSDFVYQKGLDTVQKRHHVRVWREPRSTDVWLGAAAEDVGFRFELMHWTHSTASRIDNERAKVVNDLAFTRCLDAAQLMPRHSPDLLKDSREDRPILTDTDVAVVQLNACESPRMMPGVEATSNAEQRRGLRHLLTSLRNDLRLNVFFTTYNTLKLVTDRRALHPLRKAPSVDIHPPGLDWLSSLPSDRASRP